MKRFIQSSAEADLIRQFAWYVEKGLPEIALRFRGAVRQAMNALMAMHGAGAPKHIATQQLVGLRAWPLKGFEEFRVYYLQHTDGVIVLRILHEKRDVGRILEEQVVEDPSLR